MACVSAMRPGCETITEDSVNECLLWPSVTVVCPDASEISLLQKNLTPASEYRI
jgi:hypothetical protein